MKKTIYEKIIEALEKNFQKEEVFFGSDLKSILASEYEINPGSILLTDYCYNRYNEGIVFDKHLFEYLERNKFKYLGENYPYSGKVFHKPKRSQVEHIVGEWVKGELKMF